MTERLTIRPLLGFLLVQVALFQLTLWAHLSGNHTGTVMFGSLTASALAGSLGYYWFASRPRRAEPARAAGRQSGFTPTPAPFQPSSGDQVRALVLGTMGFVVTFMVWGSIAPLALTFKSMYSLTNTQVSLLIAVPVLLGSLGRLPMGMLADRFGPRQVYAALTAFLVVPLILMGFTNSYVSLIGVAFFLGAAGSSFAAGVPFVSRWFPPAKQGLALGIFGAGNFGQALGVLYAPRMAGLISWEYTYWTMTIPVLLMAAAIWFLGKDAPKPAIAAAQGGSIWVNSNAWLFAVFYFVTFGGFVAFGNYLPKLYAELHTMDATQAGTYTAIFVLGATLARPLGGWLSDLFGAVRVLLLVFSLVILGGLGLATAPVLLSFNLLIVALALGLGVGNGAVFKLVPQYFPGRTGAVTGMVGAMGGLGGFFPPLVMGMLRDQVGSYSLGFVFLSALAVAALMGVLSLWTRPTAGDGLPVAPRA